MNKSAIRWLRQRIGKSQWYIWALLGTEMLHGGSSVVYALLLRRLIDEAVNGRKENFLFLLGMLILLVIAQIALRTFIRHTSEAARSRYENLLKSHLFSQVLCNDYAAVNKVHSGEWMNRLTSDTVVAANGMADILPEAGGMLVKLLGAIAALIIMEPRFMLLMLPAGGACLLMTYLLRRAMKRMHKDVQERDGNLRSFLQESIGSMLVVRSFSAEEQTVAQADNLMEGHRNARMTRNRFANICNVGFLIGMNGMMLFGVAYCAFGILGGTITYGTLTAVIQLVGQIQSPLANITGYLPQFYSMVASAERLMEIEKAADHAQTPSLSAAEIASFYQQEMQGISMQIQEFTYQNNAQSRPCVLRDVDLHIGKGEFIALTGDSGCGKSTLLKLLLCLYSLEHGERVLETEKRGTIPLTAAYHRLFAYVPQGNHLMSGTIREIIAFADKSRVNDEAAITKALQIACAEEFVSGLPQGTDTLLGERGAGLSEGQMQRLAIARAIFADCPILLLDEATSALDEETEKTVLRNLREMTEKTVLIVTHRPAALAVCDRVFHMNAAAELPENEQMGEK